MWWMLVRAGVAAVIVVTVSEVSRRSPRFGGLLLTLPLISILAFAITWAKDHDLPAMSRLARETLVLVPLGLPCFIPLAFADRLGLSFWTAMALGLILASALIAAWFAFGPRSL